MAVARHLRADRGVTAGTALAWAYRGIWPVHRELAGERHWFSPPDRQDHPAAGRPAAQRRCRPHSAVPRGGPESVLPGLVQGYVSLTTNTWVLPELSL